MTAENAQALVPGTLYIVSTPIGNLRDITIRAIDTLSAVDLIAAENTRHSLKLLRQYQIATKLVSYHDHNKVRQTPILLRHLAGGKTVALLTDAGTPGIADPGYFVIRAAIREGIPIDVLPGPTAFVPALLLSGLPPDRFVFSGFVPAKKGRETFFTALETEVRTTVMYESPHRIAKTLNALRDRLGDRPVALVRELTKRFQEVLRGTAAELAQQVAQTPVRGELVLVVGGAEKKKRKPLAKD